MAQIDKVRILVVGDSGVGKTSLVHLICHNEPILNPYWTIGAGVEVKLHEYKAGMPAEKTYFVELWDIGGWSAHKNSRAVFYNPVHGLILCHDLTNKKSQQNLKKWLAEILNRDRKNVKDPYEYDPEQYAGAAIPMLVIGTKLDLAQASHNTTSSRGFNIAEECGADEIRLDCTCTKHLAPGTSNSVKLSRFFDKVIERKYYQNRDIQQAIVWQMTQLYRVADGFDLVEVYPFSTNGVTAVSDNETAIWHKINNVLQADRRRTAYSGSPYKSSHID